MKTFFRIAGAVALAGWAALAGPPLTTIQDVLYKADGTRFNGTVTISWTSFEAADQSAIATQTVTAKVLDGNLRVQLVPNTQTNPLTYYTAVYNSDGHVQFSETWAIPLSAQPLRIRDVRVAAPGPLSNDTNPPTTPVAESDVVGLLSDLNARPLKGPAFAAGRVAMVNPLGALDSVAGDPGDCVRVDGSSGPCGGQQPAFLDGDIPSGIVDGANTAFTLSGTPSPGSSLVVYLNGLLQAAGVDYTLVKGNVIQFVAASTPQPGDTLLASYRLATTTGSMPQLFPTPQVLCSGTGLTVNAATFSSLGNCTIPAGTLNTGDRVEVHFDLAHQGVTSGFTFEVHWGGTTVLHRDATAADAQLSGRAEAGLDQSGAQVSAQSWGTTLPLSAVVASASDSYGSGLVLDFEGKTGAAGETLTLRNYTVVRMP